MPATHDLFNLFHNKQEATDSTEEGGQIDDEFENYFYWKNNFAKNQIFVLFEREISV